MYDPIRNFETFSDEEEKKDKVGDLNGLDYEITKEPIIEENPRGSKVKSLMLSAIRFSRAQREPTLIGLLNKYNNFDFLGLRQPSHKLNKKVTAFLERVKEPLVNQLFFTEYVYKID